MPYFKWYVRVGCMFILMMNLTYYACTKGTEFIAFAVFTFIAWLGTEWAWR